jgi:hypothetical protein
LLQSSERANKGDYIKYFKILIYGLDRQLTLLGIETYYKITAVKAKYSWHKNRLMEGKMLRIRLYHM